MRRGAVLAVALASTSCRERDPELRAAPDPAPPMHVGAEVTIDAFQIATCDLVDLAFRDRRHGYVRDACGSTFGTTDGGESFVVMVRDSGRPHTAAFPLFDGDELLDWHSFPEAAPVDSGVTFSIDPGRRLLVADEARYGRRLLAIRTKGTTRVPIVATAPSKYGLVAWTEQTVLGRDGPGPLVARRRLPHGTIAFAARPHEREWLVRTHEGKVLRSSKRGWIRSDADPFELVPGDDFDAWLLERAAGHTAAKSATPIAAAFSGEAQLDVTVFHQDCSSTHREVTYTLRRDGGIYSVAEDGGAARRLARGAAEEMVARLGAAWELSAVPERWVFGSQGVEVTLRFADGTTMRGRYAYPSPLVKAVLTAFGE